MAVITYTVSVSGSTVTTSPTPDQIKLTTGDFMIFVPDKTVRGEILVQMTGGSKIYVAAAPETGEMVLETPTVDSGGNVTIAFEDTGGNSGEGDGFPP